MLLNISVSLIAYLCNNLFSLMHRFRFNYFPLSITETLVPVLKFCTTLLVVGQLGEHDFPTFANHLNGLFIDENITKYINNYESDDSDDMDDFELLHLLQSEKKYAAEVLYEYWCDIFERCKCMWYILLNSYFF